MTPMRDYRCGTGTAFAAIASACAYACTGSAAAIAAIATRAGPVIITVPTGINAVAAIDAVGSITASGIDGAPAEKVERVVLGKFYTRTSASLSAGIGSHAGKRRARGDVEIYRALNGQSAAADRGVSEREVARDVIVRCGSCAAQRLPRCGASIQGRPVCRGGLRRGIDRLPFIVGPCALRHGAEQGNHE